MTETIVIERFGVVFGYCFRDGVVLGYKSFLAAVLLVHKFLELLDREILSLLKLYIPFIHFVINYIYTS